MTDIVWARTKLQGPRPWIFLAGPTTRTPETIPSWRPDAVKIFERRGFEGTLLIPEDGPDRDPFDEQLNSEKQVHWEWDAIEQADCVMFWIPRLEEGQGLMGLTTNTEFGYLVKSGKVVLGFPRYSAKNGYLRMLGARHGVHAVHDLGEVVGRAQTVAHECLETRPRVEW